MVQQSQTGVGYVIGLVIVFAVLFYGVYKHLDCVDKLNEIKNAFALYKSRFEFIEKKRNFADLSSRSTLFSNAHKSMKSHMDETKILVNNLTVYVILMGGDILVTNFKAIIDGLRLELLEFERLYYTSSKHDHQSQYTLPQKENHGRSSLDPLGHV